MQTCVRLNSLPTSTCRAACRHKWQAGLSWAGQRSCGTGYLGGALHQGAGIRASVLQQQTSLCSPLQQQHHYPPRWQRSIAVAHAATAGAEAPASGSATISLDTMAALRAALEVCFNSSNNVLNKPERWTELLLAHVLLPSEKWVVEGVEWRLPLDAAARCVEEWLCSSTDMTLSSLVGDEHLRRFHPLSSGFVLKASPSSSVFLSLDSAAQEVVIDLQAVQTTCQRRWHSLPTFKAKRQLAEMLGMLGRYQPWISPAGMASYMVAKLALMQPDDSVAGRYVVDTSDLSILMPKLFGTEWRTRLELPQPGKLFKDMEDEAFWKATSSPGAYGIQLDTSGLLKEGITSEALVGSYMMSVLRLVRTAAAATTGASASSASPTPARSGLFGPPGALRSSSRSRSRTEVPADTKFGVGQWYKMDITEDSRAGSSTSSSSLGSTGTGSSSSSSSRSLISTDQEPAEQDARLLTAAMQSVQGHADADSLVHLLPNRLHPALQPHFDPGSGEPALLEVIIDEGRPVELRLADGTFRQLPQQYNTTVQEALTALGVAETAAAGSQPTSNSSSVDEVYYSGAALSGGWQGGGGGKRRFGSDKRLTLPGSLHRVSAIKDKWGEVTGLTYRVGRHLPGLGQLIQDVLVDMAASLQQGTPRSLLLLGRPGLGKTTLLRDIARTMSDPVSEGGLGLNVMVIDTSNEVAGDGAVPHSCIGRARRMMVGSRKEQAAVMVEAVQNHTPQVIIIDEMGTKEEVAAARTIAERGVLLVATAHGNTLQNVLRNPELRPLLGNVQPVILGDKIASTTNKGRKMRLERSGPATFPILVELQAKNRWRLHPDVEHNVDCLLAAEGGLLDDPTASSLRSQYSTDRTLSPLGSDWEDWEDSSDEEGGEMFADPFAKDTSKGPQRLVTQLRGFAASGDVLLQFETKAAAAAWEAQA